MTRYVKVTLKEFEDMREAIESNASHAQGSDDECSYDEAVRAQKAARAVEKRNGIEPPPHLQ